MKKGYILIGSNTSTTDASFSGEITVEGTQLKMIDEGAGSPVYDEAYFDLCEMVGYREVGIGAVAVYF